MRDAFHQAAVADEDAGAVIDDRVAGAVERRRRAASPRAPCRRRWRGPGRAVRSSSRRRASRRVPDGRASSSAVGESASARRSAGRSRSGEAARTAASSRGRWTARSGRDPASAGCAGLCLQMPRPQRDGDLRHAHRHAGMAALRRLDGVHRQRADRVRELAVGRDVGVAAVGLQGLCIGRGGTFVESMPFDVRCDCHRRTA